MDLKPPKLINQVSQNHVRNDTSFLPENQISQNVTTSTKNQITLISKKLYLNGYDLAKIIRENAQHNPQVLAKIANELEKLKKKVRKKLQGFFFSKITSKKKLEELATILSLCDAYIREISERVSRRYQSTKSGIHIEFDENGQLILNGMNINMAIERCQENPTPKSKVFLHGIYHRLRYILEHSHTQKNYERINEIVAELFQRIELILDT